MVLEDTEKKKIWICDVACPEQANITAKRNEKVTPGYNITIVSIVIGALGGGIKEVLRDVERVFSKHSERE